MKYIIVIVLLFFPLTAFSADGETTGYFGALWDFIDWVYEAFDNFTQSILDFLVEMQKTFFYYYIKMKISMAGSIWSVVSPMIDALNLTDVVANLFGGLSQDIKMIITEFRIGEAINLLISAYATRTIFRMVH